MNDKTNLVAMLQNVIRGKAAMFPELGIVHERSDGITILYKGIAYVVVVHDTPYSE